MNLTPSEAEELFHRTIVQFSQFQESFIGDSRALFDSFFSTLPKADAKLAKPNAIILDIEGTIIPLPYVREVLFPFFLANVVEHLRNNWLTSHPYIRELFANELPAELSETNPPLESDLQRIKTLLETLVKQDCKVPAFKGLQGEVWKHGFESGILRAPMFSDVPKALQLWSEENISLYIYSSGSVAAQKLLLAHTEFGNLLPFFTTFFDTTFGPKQSSSSYILIAANIQVPCSKILFFTDSPNEAAAAAQAGFSSCIVHRPLNKQMTYEELSLLKSCPHVRTLKDITFLDEN